MRHSTLTVKGFTLIELMITITIVAILAAVAIPSYLNYTRRAYFSEMIDASSPYKLGVVECFQEQGTLANCVTMGVNHVPAAISNVGNVQSVAVSGGSSNVVITVTPVPANGITTADTYTLTGTISGDTLTWVSGGGCVSGGVC